MTTKLTKIAAIAVSSAALAGTATADLIAGWDFSQYRVDGTLDSGVGPDDTLPANYSSLDATFAAGGSDPGDSADFGTMFMDGSFGSDDVAEASASPAVVAHAHDTEANDQAPLTLTPGSFPQTTFDAFNILAAEGQVNQQRTALIARADTDVVFRADQGAASNGAWQLSFAGYSIEPEPPTGPVEVDVEFAPDCGAYGFVQTVTLTGDEQAFDLLLGNATVDDGCVRLALDTTNGQPVIDNVALPEPGAASGILAGALLLAGLQRRRRS